jgi:phasin family protein
MAKKPTALTVVPQIKVGSPARSNKVDKSSPAVARQIAVVPKMVAQASQSTTSFAETRLAGALAGAEKPQMEAKTKMEKAMKTAEQMMSFGQGNMEAMMKSSQIWAAGVQDLGKSFAATAQAQLDQTMSTWKAMAGVKSLKEAIDLQSSLARSSVETAMAQTGQLTDASIKLAEQAMAPITARVTLAVEQFARPV